MKIKTNKIIIAIVLSQLTWFFSIQNVFSQNILAQEDFDDFNDDGWTKIHESGPINYSNQWSFFNGMYGLKINTPFTVENSLWGDNNWTDYEVSFDMLPISGADKNFILRYQDRSDQNTYNRWYEIHVSGTTIHISKIGYGDLAPAKNIQIFNGIKYTWKVKVVGKNIVIAYKKYYESEYKTIFDIEDQTTDPILNGKIGIRIGTGAAYPTEIYFDNIVVTDLSPNRLINVPHFSQLDQSWADIQYDHANQWASNNAFGIKYWGCALTSASMILNYYGYSNTPQSLNQYLIDNNGYNSWGGVIWSYFTKFARDAKAADPNLASHKLLEFSYPAFSQEILDHNLEANQPSIIKLLTNPTNNSNHFVVFTGQNTTNHTNLIHDPLTLNTAPISLTEVYPSATPLRIAQFTPSNTDLSYIWIYTDPAVNLTTSNQNNYINFDSLESESIGSSTNEYSPKYKTLLLSKPNSGVYRLKASATQAGIYSLEIAPFDQDGNDLHRTINLFISPENAREITINYDKENIYNSSIVARPSIKVAKQLVNYGLDHNLINETNAKHILHMINQIQKQADKGNQTASSSIRQALIGQINEFLSNGTISQELRDQLIFELSL